MSGGRGFSNNRNNQRGYNGGYNNNNGGRGRGFRKNRFNNNSYNNNNWNNHNNNKNNLPEEALPPMTYDAKPDKQNRVKVEWTHGRTTNAQTESEKIAVYDDTATEDYF